MSAVEPRYVAMRSSRVKTSEENEREPSIIPDDSTVDRSNPAWPRAPGNQVIE
jgi:hypothetical protein